MDRLIPDAAFAAERARRLRVRASGPSQEDLAAAIDRIAHAVPAAARTEVNRALDFVAALDYPGSTLGAETYLAHVYRVTELAIMAVPGQPATAAVLGLLHNVIEVASASHAGLEQAFGSTVAEAVETLTVDRSQQFDLGYKQAYYRRIAALGTVASAVKACDKVDNLFTLCLNPDLAARTRYIEEIRRFVVPLAGAVSPALERTVAALADDATQTGHMQELTR